MSGAPWLLALATLACAPGQDPGPRRLDAGEPAPAALRRRRRRRDRPRVGAVRRRRAVPGARAARQPARALRRVGGPHVPVDEGRAPGRDRAAVLRAAVRPARGRPRAPALVARLGAHALHPARRDGARVRRDRHRPVRDAQHLLEPEGAGRQRVRTERVVLSRQLGLLRPVDLRALPRDRDSGERGRGALPPRRRALADRGSAHDRHHVGRAPAVVLAVELRRADRRGVVGGVVVWHRAGLLIVAAGLVR